MSTLIEAGPGLAGPELARYVSALARRRDAWEHLIRHDRQVRTYERLHRDRELDAWLICWSEEQDTGFHDHDTSSGAVAVIAGAVREERLVLGGAPVSRTYDAPASFHFDASIIHRVQHVGSVPAVTIHVYSPPLERMGAYRTAAGGELVRETVPYTEELKPSSDSIERVAA